MILESEQERIAFEFICDLANSECDRHGCNDLNDEVIKSFDGLTIASSEIELEIL
jgi:hypothetical protein